MCVHRLANQMCMPAPRERTVEQWCGASELAAAFRRASGTLLVDALMHSRMCRMLWAVIKRFMDPSSAAKFQFLSGPVPPLVRLPAAPFFDCRASLALSLRHLPPRTTLPRTTGPMICSSISRSATGIVLRLNGLTVRLSSNGAFLALLARHADTRPASQIVAQACVESRLRLAFSLCQQVLARVALWSVLQAEFLPARFGGSRPDTDVKTFVGSPKDLLPGGRCDYFAKRWRPPRSLP